MTCLSRSYLIASIFLFLLVPVWGQQDTLWMTSWNATWDDSFFEWEIHYETPNGEEDYGSLEATWSHLNDWSQWDFLIGNYSGNIWRKWDNRDDEWEVRCNGNVTRIKTKWLNDYSEWTIQLNDGEKITWIARDFNDGNVWRLKNKTEGEFEFYTDYPDDPRDWLIYDTTIDDYPFEIKLACCFISMYRSISSFR